MTDYESYHIIVLFREILEDYFFKDVLCLFIIKHFLPGHLILETYTPTIEIYDRNFTK